MYSKKPTTREAYTDDRKIQIAKAESVYNFHDRAVIRMAEWGRSERFPTGWTQFDEYLYGGFGMRSDGELVVIAGDTKIGKSTLVANIALRLANSGAKVHYMSLENSYDQTYGMLWKVAGTGDEGLFDYKDIITFPPEELIFGEEAWSADTLIDHMEFQSDARGTDVFVLDHLNFMFENEEQLGNEINRVRVVMRKLSRFAVKHKATIICISHMNKGGIGASNSRPSVDRIYGSAGIAGAATKILLLHKPEQQNPEQKIIEVQLARSRHTKDRDESFQFDATTTKWRELGIKYL